MKMLTIVLFALLAQTKELMAEETNCCFTPFHGYIVECSKIEACEDLDKHILQVVNNPTDVNQLIISDSTIDDFDFSSLSVSPTLVEFNIHNSTIRNLPSDAFKGFPQVVDLSLIGNQIQSVDDDAFFNIRHHLFGLVLKNNSMPFRFRLINRPGCLRRLDLSHSDLGGLQDDSLEGLQQLFRLDMSYCNIDELPPGLFKNLRQLDRLDLRGNNIREFNADLVSHLEHLDSIQLDGNKIAPDVVEELYKKYKKLD